MREIDEKTIKFICDTANTDADQVKKAWDYGSIKIFDSKKEALLWYSDNHVKEIIQELSAKITIESVGKTIVDIVLDNIKGFLSNKETIIFIYGDALNY